MIEILILEQKIKQMQDNINLYTKTVDELSVELENYEQLGVQLEQALINQRAAAVVSISSRKNTVYDCRLTNGYISSYRSKITNYNSLLVALNKDLETVLRQYKIMTDEPSDNVIYLEKVKNARK